MPYLLFSIIIFLSAFAHSQEVIITSHELTINEKVSTAVFQGAVVAKLEDMDIISEKMTVYYGQNEAEKHGWSINRIEIGPNIKLVTAEASAQASHGHYDMKAEKIILLGNVVLYNANNTVKGEMLEYDIKTKDFELKDPLEPKKKATAVFKLD